MKKNKTYRVLAIILAITMMLSMFPFAYATETGSMSTEETVTSEYETENEKTEVEAEGEAVTAEDTATLSLTTSAASETIVASGTIDNGTEEGLTWVITADDAGNQTLTITGTGAIPDYSSATECPWYGYRSTNTTIILGEGITRIGNRAFYGWRIADIEFSSTITSIGSYAFQSSSGLTSITIPGNITTIESYAFTGTQIFDITLEEGVTSVGESAFPTITTGTLVVHIPNSLTSMVAISFPSAAAFEVSQLNPDP